LCWEKISTVAKARLSFLVDNIKINEITQKQAKNPGISWVFGQIVVEGDGFEPSKSIDNRFTVSIGADSYLVRLH